MNETNSEWIFAHRGLWADKSEQNSRLSISSALDSGFGVETDFRDFLGDLAIAHDPLLDDSVLFYDHSWSNFRFAFNIKSDGLSFHFKQITQRMNQTNSFVFDGSLPEMFKLRSLGIPHALRLSEYEKELPWNVNFVWVDGFEGDWWLENSMILNLLQDKHLIFVSPELHARDYRFAFDWFSQLRGAGFHNFSVCTDHPRQLRDLCG